MFITEQPSAVISLWCLMQGSHAKDKKVKIKMLLYSPNKKLRVN